MKARDDAIKREEAQARNEAHRLAREQRDRAARERRRQSIALNKAILQRFKDRAAELEQQVCYVIEGKDEHLYIYLTRSPSLLLLLQFYNISIYRLNYVSRKILN